MSGTGYTVSSSLAAYSGQTLDLLGSWSLGTGVTITVDSATFGLGTAASLGGITLTSSTLDLLSSYTYAQLQPLLGGNDLVIGPGGVLDNTGATIALDATTGNLTLTAEAATLKGGTVFPATGGSRGHSCRLQLFIKRRLLH